MVTLKFEADIAASAERVFALLADLRGYDRWLPGSRAFHGTVAISGGPIAVGTTYVEPGPLGTRHGLVTEMDRPTRLTFEQPMTLKPRFTGVIGIKLVHRLTRPVLPFTSRANLSSRRGDRSGSSCHS